MARLLELLITLPPFILTGFLVLFRLPIPIPTFIYNIVKAFIPSLTVKEAEELDVQFALDDAKTARGHTTSHEEIEPAPTYLAPKDVPSGWKNVLLRTFSFLEVVVWTVLSVYNLVNHIRRRYHGPFILIAPYTPFFILFSWAYTFLRLIGGAKRVTPPYDIFILLLTHFTCAGGALLYQVLYIDIRDTTALWEREAQWINFAVITVLTVVLLSMPLNVRRELPERDDKLVTSPEDYTTLWGWATFNWVNPLVSSSKTRLEDENVWDLSSTIKTRYTFWLYNNTPASTVFRRLLISNGFDLVVDFLLTEVSVFLDFTGPYFLQRILSGLENPGSTPQEQYETRKSLYLFAVLSFACTLVKAENDLQHLWYGRRAASRVGTQLSAAIYDKALRITDQSGVTSKKKDEDPSSSPGSGKASGTTTPTKDAGKNKGKDAKKEAKDAKKAKKDKEDEDPQNSGGASVGKIVNLMGIDSKKLQDQVSSMPHIYMAPFQLALSCVYLYNLLGISAFAGFGTMVIVLPLSKLLADQVMKINKGSLAAKDERMKMVDEMFGSIKFIKFFAWEEQWIAKIVKQRMVEMKWLAKSRNVNIMYSLLWGLVPNSISVISFLVYILLGNKLTVSTAFTAIRLFDMLRLPLGVLPYAMITYAQTKVSLDRLSLFFDEGEVPDEVSAFTRPITPQAEELKIENASFKWTTGGVREKEVDGKDGKGKGKDLPNAPITTGPAHATASEAPLTPAEHFTEEPTLVDGLGESSESTVFGDLDRSSLSASPVEKVSFELRDINLTLEKGKLTVVTGPTASGKTALLMALLGEMDRIDGSQIIPKNPSVVDRHGLMNSIAYAAQTPWLQQQSIRDNIIFEYPFDQERYDAVIEACALNPDFKALEDGDLTEIGSKGVSLSGGQKARVALARAVYARTQYLILDDIFSAVDSHTARFLFESLLRGPLVANRTVLLVTHHVELVLPGTHYLIQMAEGRIVRQGTLAELKARGELDFIEHEVKEDTVEEALEDADETKKAAPTAPAVPESERKKARKLVDDEIRSEGGVKWKIYKTYLKASGYGTWVFVVFGIIAAEICDIGTRVWMTIWGNAYNQSPIYTLASAAFSSSPVKAITEAWPAQILLGVPTLMNSTITSFVNLNAPAAANLNNFTTTTLPDIKFPDANVHPLFYVAVYCGIGLFATMMATATEWILFTGGMRSGLALFKMLIKRLAHSTFRFFDTTPTGRILNRFGKDFETTDGMLPFMLHHCTTSVASFLGSVITVIFVVPWFTPFAVVIAIAYVRLSIGYLRTGRDLRRMESTSRSPILAGFSDLVSGIVTVRAFSKERQFLNGHFKRVDTSNRFWYFSWMLNRWLLVRFDSIGGISVFAATIFVLSGYISVGMAALSIVSAMNFSMSVYWTCRGFTELELALNAVERIVEYLEVPQEPASIEENNRPPAYWPSSTDNDSMLVVEDLEVKYAPELPSVLNGISFSLKARERVGLLGRTGCGKSTLAMTLLRFVEPTSGRILIDGIDITKIGTFDLRSRLTFIPQDATLFAGTIRENLDPFNEHTDAECLDALARVHLITPDSRKSSRAPSIIQSDRDDDATEAGPSAPSMIGSETAILGENDGKVIITLDSDVSAGGQNFSNGQRQLLAMARALLRQSAVVILDEATSSIDKAADVKIQGAIREEFNRSLLLTIAHRIGTVIDFDRLIVLDKGRIAEFDTPYNLISKEGGIFREMCIQSGTFTELEAAAKAQAQAQGLI
ncbi:hypothetical protein M422DRAFT_781226 [Sphaerobolus stellatus SS14]|uniref:ATP-dependent bile acid permease n=1 Tax=Sphaerobolus stellatus (strain SS14) TaxID=990650 RepID=A0A0C9VBK7_SPHS4|nr:hypothetical protein M422DRAFT_781226 [Sphaerobolus stellatus SS14]